MTKVMYIFAKGRSEVVLTEICIIEFAKRSNGTFRIMTEWAASNDCFVVASVVSLAEKGNEKLNNPGIDLFKIENGKIQEVWTFAEYQEIEDKFWE
ncbi:hypothetical protein [Peptoniphilus indolicus]|uniref:SnoaL-like domain-containing protein n=1 Tax=Peptoniphilus indolicus TaxID=33030 RepID=A0A379DA40_9FIRM|nr:hypothetical protein [Peptoniphilus indolicus]SUB74462.1 Uncharacterised protein [Peptoniphilus indolicus]